MCGLNVTQLVGGQVHGPAMGQALLKGKLAEQAQE
jgi:hypothetical protein